MRLGVADAPTASAEGAISFGPFSLLPGQRLLLEGDKPVRLGSRALDILIALVDRPGELVGKAELIARVWRGTFVEEGNLKFQVGALRRALGDGRGGRRYIATSAGQGYRFVAPVSVAQAPAAAPLPAAPTRQSHNLPQQLIRLIGRADAVSRIVARLQRHRLLSIVGPGGIGKTSVAIAVAEASVNTYEHGVWLVDLAPLADARLVPSAVAQVLGIDIRSDDPVPGLVGALSDRRLVLVLDNCEHVIEAAATLAAAILRGTADVHILATSREPLRVEGEDVQRLPPLSSDAPSGHLGAAEALAVPAMELFVERTAERLSEFEFTDEDAPVVAEICRKLDGIPLAIELAAARVETFGVRGLAARLDDRFRLLTGGRRSDPPRHRTLRAALDWSYEMLSEGERAVLRRLGIFMGGFTLDAACAVVTDPGLLKGDVINAVAELVEKSLAVVETTETEPRLRLLETTRAYALERLGESGEREAVAQRHAKYYRDLFEKAEIESEARPAAEWLADYAREIDNARAALDWSLRQARDPALGVVLTAAYVPVWLSLAFLAECRERAEEALTNIEHVSNLAAPLRMQLHLGLGISLYFTMGQLEATNMILTTALQLAESLDDWKVQLQVLWVLWNMHFSIGECLAAQLAAERFAQVAVRSGDASAILVGERLIANTLQYRGQLCAAQPRLDRVIALYVEPSDQRHTIWFHYHQRVLARAMLARVLLLRGFIDQAGEVARAALGEAQATDHKITVCATLRLAICPIALLTGDLIAADRGVRMMRDLATSHNAEFWKVLAQCMQGALLVKRGEFAAGLAELRSAQETCVQTGWAMFSLEFLGMFSESLMGLHQSRAALAVIDQALAKAEAGGELWYFPELLRIRGEVLLRQAPTDSQSSAEECYSRALAGAREQGARFWELRAATSLARLRRDQGRRGEARELLASVYGRFTEGFGTADLQAAKRLIDALS
jgi:predicted ATPase/DNA-binding winged helix-turn-helix (wHTH) protein